MQAAEACLGVGALRIAPEKVLKRHGTSVEYNIEKIKIRLTYIWCIDIHTMELSRMGKDKNNIEGKTKKVLNRTI